MRVNNRKARGVIISVYLMLIVLAILLATVVSAFSSLTSSPTTTFTVIVVIFLIIFFLIYSISKYFEYDSDGLKVVIVNRGLLLSDKLNYRERQLEFYKEDLISYRFNDFLFYKSVVVYCRDERGKKIKDTFNITLLSKKKRKYVRQSLSKMIKSNKKLE